MVPPLHNTAEGYREHFATSLVGRWSSAGDFSPGPVDEWEFEADGTGCIRSFSGMGNAIQLLKWRSAGERIIELQTSYLFEFDGNKPPGDAVCEWPDEDEHWVKITYDFKAMERYGTALFAVPEKEPFKFYETLDYLYLVPDRP